MVLSLVERLSLSWRVPFTGFHLEIFSRGGSRGVCPGYLCKIEMGGVL